MAKMQKTAYSNIRGDIAVPKIFDVIICPADDVGGYWAKCDMPNGGCVAQGDTLQEIQKNMMEAIELYLEDHPESADYFLNFEVRNA